MSQPAPSRGRGRGRNPTDCLPCSHRDLSPLCNSARAVTGEGTLTRRLRSSAVLSGSRRSRAPRLQGRTLRGISAAASAPGAADSALPLSSAPSTVWSRAAAAPGQSRRLALRHGHVGSAADQRGGKNENKTKKR